MRVDGNGAAPVRPTGVATQSKQSATSTAQVASKTTSTPSSSGFTYNPLKTPVTTLLILGGAGMALSSGPAAVKYNGNSAARNTAATVIWKATGVAVSAAGAVSGYFDAKVDQGVQKVKQIFSSR